MEGVILGLVLRVDYTVPKNLMLEEYWQIVVETKSQKFQLKMLKDSWILEWKKQKKLVYQS